MKQKIVCFVGADRCGKTEISKEISRRLDVPYFKAASEHDTYLRHPERFINQLRFGDTRMVDFLSQTHHSVVMDRCWACECVYSEVMGRYTDLKTLKKVDEDFAKLGAKIIICHRSSYDNIVDDIDPTIDSKRLTELDAAYKRFMMWTKCSSLLLNVDDENLDREVSDIMNWLLIEGVVDKV
jgi:hypothetical protein